MKARKAVGGAQNVVIPCSPISRRWASASKPVLRIVEHHRRAELPLAEQLAPSGLGPAGVAHRPVQVVLAKVVPVAGGQRVGDGVAVVPRHQLREGRGAGGEIGQHRLVAAGRLDRAAVEPVARRRAGGLAMDPVAVRRADRDHPLQGRAFVAHRLDLRDMVGGDDGQAGARLVDAVFDILGLQQVGARHGDDAELDAADHGLIPGRDARNHHKGEIALGRVDAAQHVGEAVGGRREVGKPPSRLFAAIGVNVDEGGLVAPGGPAVDQVESEIVEFGRRQPDTIGKRGRDNRAVRYSRSWRLREDRSTARESRGPPPQGSQAAMASGSAWAVPPRLISLSLLWKAPRLSFPRFRGFLCETRTPGKAAAGTARRRERPGGGLGGGWAADGRRSGGSGMS